MATARNAFLTVVLLVASLAISPANVGAQTVPPTPHGYTHDIPYFAINLLPGQVVEVGIWLENLGADPITLEYTGEFGTTVVALTLTVAPGMYDFGTVSITAEAIMAQCNGGVIQVNERVLQQDEFGNLSIVVSKVMNLAPCSWASSEVTPVPPVQLQTCGEDNDTIQIGRQVPGLSWDEGAWSGNSRTVTFTANPGYTLVGQNVFTFVDTGNCVAGPAESPVQQYVCGANNDRFMLPSQPPYVILGFDSGWVDHQRTFHYVADAGYTLDGSGEFVFTDQPNRLCASPLRTPPVVINTPPAGPGLPIIPIRPTPRGFPAPVITIVPTLDPSVTQPPEWTPTPTPPVWNPIPIRPTPRGFPLPTFVPFVPKAKPAPMVETEAPAQAAGTFRSGEGVVLALAPIAVILGGIAATSRRHDD